MVWDWEAREAADDDGEGTCWGRLLAVKAVEKGVGVLTECTEHKNYNECGEVQGGVV